MILRLALDLREDVPYVTLTRLLGRTTLQYLHVNSVDIGDVETILDELTSNAVRHAKSADGRFRLTLDYYADRIAIIVEDNGPGFSPDAVPSPGTPRPDLDGGERLGGFGLALVHSLTDRLEFRCEADGGTKVQAEKRLTYKTAADAHRAEDMSEKMRARPFLWIETLLLHFGADLVAHWAFVNSIFVGIQQSGFCIFQMPELYFKPVDGKPVKVFLNMAS